MEKEIWTIEFIKANPELAYKAIKTLQMLLQDLEDYASKPVMPSTAAKG